jgi:hypothetical protein
MLGVEHSKCECSHFSGQRDSREDVATRNSDGSCLSMDSITGCDPPEASLTVGNGMSE